MRKLSCIILVMLILLLQGNYLVFGLEQNEASIDISWSKQKYYQGEEGILTITFSSQSPDELKINKIEIQFNWTTSQETTLIDLSEDPTGIPSNDDYTFAPISFQVPQNASEGINNIKIKIEGTQHGLWWYDFDWISILSPIEIKTDYQYLFSQLDLEVTEKLNEAHTADYQNQEAKDLLEDATNEYHLSISLANQNKWEEATSHLEQTQELLNQAEEKEQQPVVDELTSAITTIIILILIGLIVAIVLGRKTKT